MWLWLCVTIDCGTWDCGQTIPRNVKKRKKAPTSFRGIGFSGACIQIERILRPLIKCCGENNGFSMPYYSVVHNILVPSAHCIFLCLLSIQKLNYILFFGPKCK